MNVMSAPQAIILDQTRPLAIAVLAMGGQGGGVLVDWIVDLAERQGWAAQSTSVPGVAQRTGATIYYVEIIPFPKDGRQRPVLSLTPMNGEVDIVIGAELMEGARAIQRGLVTPDRTVLIASAHRAFAVMEKIVPGDGMGDPAKVFEAAEAAAKRFIAFDMARLAEQAGSVVSAVLFGALAGSGALPFPREAFEATVRAAGVGVEPSLRAFALGFDETVRTEDAPPVLPKTPQALKVYPALAPTGHAEFDALVERARAAFPPALHGMVAAGLRKVVDYQDVAYGRDYLDQVESFLPLDHSADLALVRAAAKHVAVAMAYDDVIRVADLKTRATRFDRVRNEVSAKPDQLVYMTEFMHPRMDEVAGSLPVKLGLWIEGRPALFKALDRVINRGRRVQTGTIFWFLLLYGIAGLKTFRPKMLRHARELAHREAWIAKAKAVAPADQALALEIIESRRLVKGYSDTHARGQTKFDKVMEAAMRLQGRPDAADWVRRLRQAALLDEEGEALNGALATIKDFL